MGIANVIRKNKIRKRLRNFVALSFLCDTENVKKTNS